MKAVLLIIGVVVLLAGVLFAGQGAGVIHWPQSSFMVNSREWIMYGVGIALVGMLLIALSTRRSR